VTLQKKTPVGEIHFEQEDITETRTMAMHPKLWRARLRKTRYKARSKGPPRVIVNQTLTVKARPGKPSRARCRHAFWQRRSQRNNQEQQIEREIVAGRNVIGITPFESPVTSPNHPITKTPLERAGWSISKWLGAETGSQKYVGKKQTQERATPSRATSEKGSRPGQAESGRRDMRKT
jgi:hypothetical protein